MSEDCDHAGLAMGILAGAVDVGGSDDGVVEVVEVPVDTEVVFYGEFGDGVR